MNFRAVLGRDLESTLESGYHEMPVDRIGAFSRGSRIGCLLWRLKYAHDATSYWPAVFLLAKLEGLKQGVGTRLVEMAVNEWLMPQCEACRGARELIVGPKRIVCESCHGYGVKKYTNKERTEFLGTRFRPWARKYNHLWATMTGEEKQINPVMLWQLEK